MTTTVDSSQADITGHISEFAARLTYDDVPSSVLESAKLFTLECISHMVHSRTQPVSRIVTDLVRSLGAQPEAVVVGGGFRTSVAEAAYANGVLAHADELEACGTLPGTGLIPPITAGLAIGEQRDVSGKEFLVALVAGVEVQGRLGTAAIGACDRGFMGFSLVGPAGAAVTAGRLLSFDADRMRNCLGVALPLGGGSLRGEGYMTHVHEAGVPARTGTWAALLVDRGFTGSPDYLDGPFSWGEQYTGGSARPYRPEAVTDQLGGDLFLETSDVAPKMFGTSGVTHQSVEGTIRLMTENGLQPSDIKSVELIVPPFALRIAPFGHPVDGEQAKFSFEQAIAGLLVEGVPSLPYVNAFTNEACRDPRYAEARNRVSVAVDESTPNVRGFASQTVTLALHDGRRLRTEVNRQDVSGGLPKPLTVNDRIDVVVRTLAGIEDDSAGRLVDIIMGLEGHGVAELGQLLVEIV